MSKFSNTEKFLGWTELPVNNLKSEAELIDTQFFNENGNEAVGSVSVISIPTMKTIPS